MAFSIFGKKDDPRAPAKKPDAVPAVKRPATPDAGASARARTAPQLTQKIDQIQSEMEEFALDFTSPPPSRPATPTLPAAPAARPPAAVPSATAAATAAAAAPAAVAAAPVSSAPASPMRAVPAPGGAAPAMPAPAAPPASRAKPVIERGFDPLARSAPKPPAAALVKPGAAQPAAPAAAAPVLPPAVLNPPRAKVPFPHAVASVMMMEVEQSPFAAAPVLEEAAILYANGQDLAALAALTDALQNAKMPDAAARQTWFLLFDLYENLGRRDEFETSALDFAVRFETSPPAYHDRSGAKDPALVTGGGQYFALSGALDAAADKQFAQLVKSAARNKVLRIEFGKIESMAAAGCTLLMEHLTAFKKSGHDLVFSNTEHLIKLLNGAIETGRRSDPEIYWMLLLELYQFQHMQAAFEETALSYCITYEVSPPSWVEPAKSVSSTPPARGPTTMDVPQDAFYLKGELTGPCDLVFNDVAAHAGGKARLVIDMFSVKRIDFIAAGAFLNVVQTLRGMAKEIEIRSPSPLLAALLVSMGFLNHVRLTQRGK